VWVPVHKLESWRLDDRLPPPSEQFDNLALLVGDRQPSSVAWATLGPHEISAWIGAPITVSNEELGWLIEQGRPKGWIDTRFDGGAFSSRPSTMQARLTMTGWERYDALKRAEAVSRTAFMAMQFGDADLDQVVDHCFKPAVDRSGFELRILTDRQPAGLIDDQLRVALLSSRFVIADLTHGNNGAYWEAGFAEGLGRPVIYTCRKTEWDKRKTHFDTNHLVTIIWEPEELEDAGTRLTATIRATLPGEARLTD
jgi:hypothetical protein